MADKVLSGQIRDLINALYEISDDAKKGTKEALFKAAEPVVQAARNNAPVSEEIHYRYATPKASKRLKAPKGSGVKVATYKPGNLRDSIKAISFRRSKYAVFVGPVIKKGLTTGVFGPDYSFRYEGGTVRSTRTDGYYGAWIEFGAPNAGIPPAPFMEPARAAKGATALKTAANELKKVIELSGEKQWRKWLSKYASIRGRQ